MTKREFYEEFRGESEVTIDDIADCCRENELYDYLEFFDDYAYDDYVWEEIHNWCDGWESLGGWLNDLPKGYDWYVRRNYGDLDPVDQYDIPELLNDLEEALADTQDDWEEEESADEETAAESTESPFGTQPKLSPKLWLLDFDEEDDATGDVANLI